MRVNKRKRKVRNKTSKTYKMLTNITAAILLVILFAVIFAVINLGNQSILSGISVNGVSVSGLTIDEAKQRIDGIIQDKLKNGIKLKHDNQEYTFELNEINLDYDFDQQLQEAYKIGRSGNIVKDNFTILYMLFTKKEFNFDITYNEDLFKRQVDYLEVQLPDRAIDSRYYVEGKDLIIVKGFDGVIINNAKLKENLDAQLSNLSLKGNFEMPVIKKPLNDIDMDKIHNEIYQEAEDAYYTVEPFKIYPHVVGVDFGATDEEISEILAKDDTDYLIPLKLTDPKITLDKLDINVFPNLLSQYDTTYDVKNKNKTNNLEIAMSKINGVILKPGETFSYNKTLGARTIENGYKEAPIYSNGQVVNGLGGGICQASTTLYNCVVMADLEIVERQNHMFVPTYVNAGKDATVVYGSIDFRFKNTREYPIKIEASASNGVARVSIYGIYKEKEYKIQLETEILEITPFETVYVKDSSLKGDETQTIQKGQNGVKVETYKVVKYGSLEISRTLLSVDTYRPMQETILKAR